MPRIFAYIVHKAGVADDSAAELLAAARKIDAAASPTAIVTGWGPDLDAACESSALFLRRDLEDRQRSARLSQRRTGSQGAGERSAAAAASCWSRTIISASILRRGFPSS